MQISATKFKHRCLELVDHITDQGEEIVITRRGRPVARLIPFEEPANMARPFFGYMAGKGRIVGDIQCPLDEPWDAQRGMLLNE